MRTNFDSFCSDLYIEGYKKFYEVKANAIHDAYPNFHQINLKDRFQLIKGYNDARSEYISPFLYNFAQSLRKIMSEHGVDFCGQAAHFDLSSIEIEGKRFYFSLGDLLIGYYG